ncbi:MAG: GNAT family N-acetyltransferase [Paracoccaceae bacterium]
MTPAEMARIHAACFPLPWREDAIARMLAGGCIEAHVPGAFALARVILDEAEVLTLATDPAHRGEGRATRVLSRLIATLAPTAARRLFLEVEETNAPARALYARAGLSRVGRRADYYGPGRHALILARDLPAA